MKRNLVLLSSLVLFSVSSALAQTAPVYQQTTVPTKAVASGRSEALGSVRLTVSTASANTFADTLEFNFLNIGCDLTPALPVASSATLSFTAPGPQLTFAGTGTALAAASITAITNTSGGCVVDVTIPAGKTLVLGDYLELDGVRGRVEEFVGSPVTALVTSTPSTAALIAVFDMNVAFPETGLVFVGVDFVGSRLFCPSPITEPVLELKEGYPAAFVQYVDASTDLGPGHTLPADHRPLFGAKNNTQINIVVTGAAPLATSLPSGVTLTWNTQSSISTGSVLSLISQSSSGDNALYEFSTLSQNTSDITLDDYTIGATINLSATPSAGTSNVQIQLNPPLSATDTPLVITQAPFATGTVASPRFSDPLQPSPAATFLTIAPCTTNLLFPFVANVGTFDTGIAIANTSADPYGTTPQHGSCVLNGFPIATSPDSGATPPAPIKGTTPNIQAGDTFVMVLSSPATPLTPSMTVFNGFEGYIIAVCNFQYGHGFAFIATPFPTPGTGPDAAEGYVALIIPDPVVNAGRLGSDSSKGATNSGEGLAQ